MGIRLFEWDNNEIISISRRGVPPVLINLNQQRERFRDDFDICFGINVEAHYTTDH